MKLPLHWKWFGALAILLVDLLLVVNLCINAYLPPYLVGGIRADLERNAVWARAVFAPKLAQSPLPLGEINSLAHQLAKESSQRVTIISADGTVIGESDKPIEQLKEIENHLQRPEVQAAIQNGVGSATRRSATVDVDLLYVAVPVVAASVPDAVVSEAAGTAATTTHGQLLGIVRVALPLHQIAETKNRVRWIVATASTVVGLVAIPILFWMARRTSGPIEQMRYMATHVAQGDFSVRAPTRAPGELGELAHALDQMAGQLQSRLTELANEKAELNATLANMIEGVLVVDAAGRIRLANRALRQQLHLPDEILGKTVMEVFRNPAVEEITAKALTGEQVIGRELAFFSEKEYMLAISAARLEAPENTSPGAVLVFHDISRLKQLENIRKEFVANVSHELRTPLSIIKGYVETLHDELPPDAGMAKQFLETIQRHSRRLEALIGDLLSISALESQQARLNFEPVSLRAAAEAVLEELGPQATEKSVTINLQIPAACPAARADAQRLHQVFFNLIDNAIKYSATGGLVTVSAKDGDNEIEVCVSDNGPGIAAEHLPRIFERFYRVDKARSRDLGGTGLGLSIAKHIVQAHGGRVWAESLPRSDRGDLGKGSAFYFTLPKA